MCNKSAVITITIIIISGTKCIEYDLVPKIGEAVNIMKFHGSLSFTMRVFPSSSQWLFIQPSIKIFKEVQSVPRVLRTSKIFSGDFHMEICETYQQLFQAYFRNFSIDGVEKPWSAFMGSWSKAQIAEYFGIRQSLLTDHFKYIFIRIIRFRDSYKLAPPEEGLEINESLLDDADNVTIGDSASTTKFITNFGGTHYIESYTSGNSLFQVFVYQPRTFKFIKRVFQTRGINILFDKAVTNYFSSDFAEYVGQLRTASGNKTVEEWASINLFFPHQEPHSQNILRLFGDEILLTRLGNLLYNETLVQLNLKFTAPFFPRTEFSNWLVEFISNNLKLWDVHM